MNTSNTKAVTRVAVVTGAAQGIGRAISLRLADDGLNVVVSDAHGEAQALDVLVQEISTKQCKALAVVGDPSQEADVEKLVDTAVAQFGGLDVMIANAGMGLSNPLVSIPVQEWDLIQALNLRSVFLCYKAAAVQMIKQGRGGRIIGASSVSGKIGSSDWAAYSASKFAVRGLTQSAAAELRQHNITVNTYAPGAMDYVADNENAGLAKVTSNEFPLISPDDVAGLVSYLVRDESKFVTGQSLNINGGIYYD
ncbi:NAD-binding protein [Ramaria rubella]|nr:NAD-binding protein [Ramaria rubella]